MPFLIDGHFHDVVSAVLQFCHHCDNNSLFGYDVTSIPGYADKNESSLPSFREFVYGVAL
jgi:hypothetical protein